MIISTSLCHLSTWMARLRDNKRSFHLSCGWGRLFAITCQSLLKCRKALLADSPQLAVGIGEHVEGSPGDQQLIMLVDYPVKALDLCPGEPPDRGKDANGIPVAGRADVVRAGLLCGQKNAFILKAGIRNSVTFQKLCSGHLKPDQVIGIIDKTHLVRFLVADADCCFVSLQRSNPLQYLLYVEAERENQPVDKTNSLPKSVFESITIFE